MLARDGERYFVSMLGEQSNWVRNLQATEGRATLRHDRIEQLYCWKMCRLMNARPEQFAGKP